MRYVRVRPLPPCEHVREYCEDCGMTAMDAALDTGVDEKLWKALLAGEQPIDENVAAHLQNLFGRPAHLWLELQRQWDRR